MLVAVQKFLRPKALFDVPLALAVVGLGTLVVVAPSIVPGLTRIDVRTNFGNLKRRTPCLITQSEHVRSGGRPASSCSRPRRR